jgi:hypothetical protein
MFPTVTIGKIIMRISTTEKIRPIFFLFANEVIVARITKRGVIINKKTKGQMVTLFIAPGNGNTGANIVSGDIIKEITPMIPEIIPNHLNKPYNLSIHLSLVENYSKT